MELKSWTTELLLIDDIFFLLVVTEMCLSFTKFKTNNIYIDINLNKN